MKDIVVLPTYNEAGNIAQTIREIFKSAPEVFVTVVDDNSPDGTADVVQKLLPEFPHLKLYQRAKKAGLGAAYKDILSQLQQDADIQNVVHFDADGSHDPKYIPAVLQLLETHDLVIGSRYAPGAEVVGWDWKRKLVSRGGNFYARTITGMPIGDVSSGFIGMRKDLLDRVRFNELSGTGYAYLMEFKYYCTSKLHARVKELGIVFLPRREGESKMSMRIIIEGLILPIRVAWERVYKLIRYVISGGTATAANLGSLFVLVHYAQLYYLHASILAFIISIVVSFTMQKFWTFRDTAVHDIHAQFARYAVVITTNLLLNTIFIYLLVEKVHLYYLLAQFIAGVGIAFASYFAYRHLVFRKRTLQVV